MFADDVEMNHTRPYAERSRFKRATDRHGVGWGRDDARIDTRKLSNESCKCIEGGRERLRDAPIAEYDADAARARCKVERLSCELSRGEISGERAPHRARVDSLGAPLIDRTRVGKDEPIGQCSKDAGLTFTRVA